ncbi:MAG: helix-turn-helix transcriptional regulator [Elusimicrobiales bacterium]|nr:helix-turn-helix transcriptional regulator [Elusimicrobiales bacterium]
MQNNLEEKIKELMKKKMRTPADMARLMGISPQAFASIMKSKKSPSLQNLKKMAQVLGENEDYFISNKISAPVSQQANGNAGNVSQSVALGGGDVGAKLEVVNAKLEAITAKLDVLLERTKGK